jgi:hypothetical protein
VNSLFFWIIVLSFVVPTALRLYRKSVRGRNRDQGMPGGFPNQLDGGYPGQFPGHHPGRQSKQPRDGYTQQDYFGGAFQTGGPGQPLPPGPQYPGPPLPPNPPYPPYPGQQYPGQQGYQNPVPYKDSPEYLNNPPMSGQQPSGQPPAWQPPAGQPSAPADPPPPSGPQGFRARKLAELDQRYSNGELAMEDYMAQRAEIMKG